MNSIINPINPDFSVDGNKARLSQRKVAELIGVAQKSISLAANSDTLYTALESEAIVAKGFDGDTLSRLVVYYAFDSKQASTETKERCKAIVLKTSGKGFQDFINAIAGILPNQPEPPRALPTSFEVLIDATKLLPSIDNPLIKAAFEQRLAEELGSNNALSASQPKPVLAAVLARELGFTLKPGEDAQLGLWVKKFHKPAGKAQHGRYQVNVYERGKDLEDTIKAFF